MSTPVIPLHRISGDPYARGHLVGRLGAHHAEAVRSRALAAQTLITELGAEDWVREQWAAQVRLLPEVAAFVPGLAEEFGLTPDALFAAHVRYAVEDRHAAAQAEADECSAFAIRRRDGSALLAKNRDNPLYFRPLQLVLRQADPGWHGREILCFGSFGSIPSASSGMNTDGFCMADTSVRTFDLGVGALRYYLMEALLIRCATVADAISMLGAMPHLGGGNLVLADAIGDIAAVELSNGGIHVERGAQARWVARTNHFTDETLASALKEGPGSALRLNSESRRAALIGRLSRGVLDWTVKDCCRLLSLHEDRHGHAAICRHGETAATNAGAVFEPAGRKMCLLAGNPCEAEPTEMGIH